MNKLIIGAEREIFRQQALRTNTYLLAVGRSHARVGAKYRGCDSWCLRSLWTTRCCRKKAGCCISVRYLLECLQTVLFDCSRQAGKNVAVEENSVSGAPYPLG